MFHRLANILMITFVVSEKLLNNSADDLESRIIGGNPVPVERFPSSVKFYNFGALCSGSIINSWCVLTAAHCFDNNKEVYDMLIQVGARYVYDTTGDVYGVLNFVIHEDYNRSMPFACDVALIFVTKAIKLGKKAKKALIVNNNKWMSPKVNDILVSGWGWTKQYNPYNSTAVIGFGIRTRIYANSVKYAGEVRVGGFYEEPFRYYGGPISELGLMETHLDFVTLEDCGRMHQLHLTPDMFCLYGAGARDTCKGDSGGGVMWNDMLIGVVSHGDGCAKRDKPSVYANVWYFRGWIQTQVEDFFQNVCEMLEAREH